jgi:Protein of unknown function (DUF2934)
MPERLIDINARQRTLHTFPVSVGDPAADTGVFERKALEAAAHAHLVPNEQLEILNATKHVSRGGPLEPTGDFLGVLAETREGLEQVVRERAYMLWERAGRPAGKNDEFWHQAQHQRWCERAYSTWERENRPAGNADEHWHRTLNFERD